MVCVRLDIMQGLDYKKVLHGPICAGIPITSKDIQNRPNSRCWAGPSQCALWHTRQGMQGDQGICRVSLLGFLSPQAHVGERLKEACDGDPYMLWTSHEHHGEDGHCGSRQSMRGFSFGYDRMVLLQCFWSHSPSSVPSTFWQVAAGRGIAVAMFASRARSRNAIVSLLGPQRLVCEHSLPISLRI